MSISTSFRPLNEHEIQAIASSRARGKLGHDHPLVLAANLARVSYEKMQGGFCVCVIVYVMPSDIPSDPSYLVLRGASRRSYKDPRKPIRGEMLAFSRAILYSRPVELS